jgi:hypothetical protein
MGSIISSQSGKIVVRLDDEPFFYPDFMPEEYQEFGYTSIYIRTRDTFFCNNKPRYREWRGHGQGKQVPPYSVTSEFEYKLGLGVVDDHRPSNNNDIWKDKLYRYRKGGVDCLFSDLNAGTIHYTGECKLYPQPATTEVFLEAPQLRYPATICIHNLQGPLLSQQQITTAGKPISTANLPAGLYLLSVTDAGGNSGVQKLLIEAN